MKGFVGNQVLRKSNSSIVYTEYDWSINAADESENSSAMGESTSSWISAPSNE